VVIWLSGQATAILTFGLAALCLVILVGVGWLAGHIKDKERKRRLEQHQSRSRGGGEHDR